MGGVAVTRDLGEGAAIGCPVEVIASATKEPDRRTLV
jgi:hypothetical protein